MKISIDYLTSSAKQFRTAIEKAYAACEFEHDYIFREFPNGCCGEASDLLGHHLLLKGIASNYVCGNFYYDNPEIGFQSHAWIEINGIIVDITGDQFKYKEEFMCYDIPIFVGRPDNFHKLFDVDERDIRDSVLLNQIDGFDIAESIKRYNTICRYLDK